MVVVKMNGWTWNDTTHKTCDELDTEGEGMREVQDDSWVPGSVP